jgi:hypothetical protein
MSEILKPCPFCGINDWQHHAYFSGAIIRQCGGCGAIVDESVINTRPIEDELRLRIAELEAKNNRLVELAEGLADMVDWSGCDCDKPYVLTEWEEFIAGVQE